MVGGTSILPKNGFFCFQNCKEDVPQPNLWLLGHPLKSLLSRYLSLPHFLKISLGNVTVTVAVAVLLLPALSVTV